MKQKQCPECFAFFLEGGLKVARSGYRHGEMVVSITQPELHRLRAGRWLRRDAWNENRRLVCPASQAVGAEPLPGACWLSMDVHDG